MAIYQLPSETDVNFSQGIDQLFVYVSGQVPIFIPCVLFAFFLLISLGGYMLQRRQEARGHFKAWAAAAGILTSVLATLFTLIPGLIPIEDVIITYAITAVFIIVFLLHKER